MAFSRTISLVCVVVAAVCGVTLSQAPGGTDQSLFNLMSGGQPSAGTGGMTGMGGLDSILNTMGGGGTGSFATGTGSQAPNPTFPTMGGGGFPSMGGATSQPMNSMASIFPFLIASGLDMNKMMMMALFGGLGGGMGGGGMGGMGMLPIMGLLSNM